MAYTVELVLDDALDADVRARWERLAAAGLPSQARHRSTTNAPHLTLAVTDDLTDPTRAALRGIFSALPLPARLQGLATFAGREGVLYWAVEPSPELRALHARVVAALDEHGQVTRPMHAPDRWTPHVTLARRMTREQLAAAHEIFEPGWRAADGKWAQARSFDTVERVLEPLGPPRAGWDRSGSVRGG